LLTVYRGNRAEFLAELLATQLRIDPPDPFETVEVVVNTWPTSRWLGEQLALGLGGIAANIRFPFPGSQLRRLVAAVLGEGERGGSDPWRASELVWPVLELLEVVVQDPQGEPLRRWLQGRGGEADQLDLARWQLGRAIADALDDYALYRPEELSAWWHGHGDGWQPLLVGLLRQRLGVEPFGLRVQQAIARLRQGEHEGAALPARLRLFGLSAMAPVQVQLLQALAGRIAVDLYLLTPCPDLWQRCSDRRRLLSDAVALQHPLDGEWMLQAPGLEARFGRLGAEFQQLLEGTGEAQLGASRERDLFVAPVSAAGGSADVTLLAQLQRQLADPGQQRALSRADGDASLEFHPCPGRLRQVQIVRDRVLQLLAANPELQPRDVLVMTPQIDAYAPLLASVFGDSEATGVHLPWRLTDRSQQGEADLGRTLLQLLELAAQRFTATSLETLLEGTCLQQAFALERHDIVQLNRQLQRVGFRWGLAADERGGSANGSLAWAMDRLLLGLVLPEQPGLAPAATAPMAAPVELELLGRWLHLLGRLRHWLWRLRRSRSAEAWAVLLRELLADLFAEDGALLPDQAFQLPLLLAAIDDWQQAALSCPLKLSAPVVAAGLEERLGVDSGRFGHRSGALTISALEPMRAIPHRVIVLMGLDAGVFPRQRQRPGFHLLEQQRRLGDPHPADQDRYVLLEALLSARDHLLLCWSSRDERSGEPMPPATPVRQWLEWLQPRLGPGADGLVATHAASPLDRRNFRAGPQRPAASCDQRLLQACMLLDDPLAVAPLQPLVASVASVAGPASGQDSSSDHADSGAVAGAAAPALDDLCAWLLAPQRQWLRQLGLAPREWSDLLVDLDAAALAERERVALLREVLDTHDEVVGQDGGFDQPDAWLQRWRGRARLPQLAAGELEARTLASRWRELQAALAPLGPQRQQQVCWQGGQRLLRWQGDTLVLVHPARARSAHQLELWFGLLLAAAAGQAPRSALLIARGDKGFAVVSRYAAPQAAAAAAELERLAALRQRWRQRCWPVPPETAWALATAGEARAISTWEGGPLHPGECAEPEQVLCFGAELSGRELLAPRGELAPAALVAELLGPLLEHRQ